MTDPPRSVRINLIGGPLDGEAILELSSCPPGLEIKVMEVEGHPEGFYQWHLCDNCFHWEHHQDQDDPD